MILSIAYGIDVEPENDPYLMRAETNVQIASEVAIPGTYLVVSFTFGTMVVLKTVCLDAKDTIPILKYVPSWMPGAGFKRKAKKWAKDVEDMINLPFEKAKKLIVKL